ncbi:MAG: peptidase M28, partial [Verrucomicrobiae bacterium]|nr:peptidase M28 [Verrucomicrobiae bacterium]
MWQQIQANRRRSIVLIITMGGLLLLLGALAGEAIVPGGYLIGATVAAIIWLIQLSLYFGAPQSVLLTGLGARQLQKEDSPRL